MARKPVSVFKRPMTKKGQFRYYLQLWDEAQGQYTGPRSAQSVVTELGLDPKAFPPTSRTGALLIGEELRRRGSSLTSGKSPFLSEYLAEFWDWDTSSYIQGKLARGLRIGREYVDHCAACVRNYIAPAFPRLRLSDLRPYMIEDFTLRLKREAGLSNQTVNGILSALTVPIHEAARLGILTTDPAASIQKLGRTTAEKGIPTEAEMRALLSLQGLDMRIRCAVLLGAACALRLGEIQAIRLANVGAATLTVSGSWGKVEGLKQTKTGRVRVVPLPAPIRAELITLSQVNPHGPEGFLMFGLKPCKPLDIRALERMFYKALEAIGIDEASRVARHLSFHSLRHWSNAMLRGAVSDEKLHMLTGHASNEMTDHYDHATEADLSDLAQAQEARILPLLGGR